MALKLNPSFALAYNNRAVLYKKLGDRGKALADYEAALRLDPGNENAHNGRRIMTAEIAKFGRQTLQPATQVKASSSPSFDCAAVLRPVEKVICGDPQLGTLDRQIAVAYARQLKTAKAGRADRLREAQRVFLADRSARFGQPGYDLLGALQRRLEDMALPRACLAAARGPRQDVMPVRRLIQIKSFRLELALFPMTMAVIKPSRERHDDQPLSRGL